MAGISRMDFKDFAKTLDDSDFDEIASSND